MNFATETENNAEFREKKFDVCLFFEISNYSVS